MDSAILKGKTAPFKFSRTVSWGIVCQCSQRGTILSQGEKSEKNIETRDFEIISLLKLFPKSEAETNS